MILSDILLIAALAAFVVVWWLRSLRGRPALLAGLALVALVAGVWGLFDDRWQAGVGVVAAIALLLTLLANRQRKAQPRHGRPFVSGTVFALLAVTAAIAIVMFPVDPLPRPSGKYPVGTRAFEVDDASRPGVFAAKKGEPRRLLVRVWYPAGDISGRKPRPYFTNKEAHTTARTLGALVGFPPFFSYVKHVRTNSYEDAPLLPGASRLPVVIYSHGYTSFLAQNTALMEHLASHGYVVFSVQHTYNSSTTVFPNGDVAPADPELFKAAAEADEEKGKPRPQVQALVGKTVDDRLEGYLRMREAALKSNARLLRSGVVWTADRIFLHDELQRGAVPLAIRQITAASDLGRVGEMGMSFGGATAGSICMVDRRCAAGINLDGGDFPFQAFDADMPVPFLMFHSDLANIYRGVGAKPEGRLHSFNEFSYESFGRAGANAGLHRVTLRGAQHLGISDFSRFVRRPLRDPLFGTTPSRVLTGAQNDFVLGFFDRYLRGQANAFPQAELKRYRRWVTPIGAEDVRAWWAAKPEADRAAIEARVARLRVTPAN